jgi:hypothetical protein
MIPEQDFSSPQMSSSRNYRNTREADRVRHRHRRFVYEAEHEFHLGQHGAQTRARQSGNKRIDEEQESQVYIKAARISPESDSHGNHVRAPDYNRFSPLIDEACEKVGIAPERQLEYLKRLRA